MRPLVSTAPQTETGSKPSRDRENGPVNTRPGRAIFLLGPSSSGKSSIGKALVESLPDPFMFFETDRCGLRGPSGRPELQTLEREEVVTRGAAFAIRGYLEAGLDLVVEIGFWHPGVRLMAAAVFEPFDAWLVGLRWELAELDVLPREVGDATDGRTTDRAVHPVMVVAMQPVRKCPGPV